MVKRQAGKILIPEYDMNKWSAKWSVNFCCWHFNFFNMFNVNESCYTLKLDFEKIRLWAHQLKIQFKPWP